MARSVRQLKEEARRAEQREAWSRAVELYLEALRISEQSGDISLDLSLYNRIGDLYRRGGQTGEAVRFYRKAVEQYADQGLHTGAVALCNKILRLAPDEIDIYRVLGRLHASSGLAAEARKAFAEYAERMEERGDAAAVQDGHLELARAVEDVELLADVVEDMVAAGREDEARAALRDLREERGGSLGGADPRVRELAERLGVIEGGKGDASTEARPEEEDAPEEAASTEGDRAPAGRGAADPGAPAAEPDDRPTGAETADPADAGAAPAEDAAEGDAAEDDVEGVEMEEILLHEPDDGSDPAAEPEDDASGDGAAAPAGPEAPTAGDAGDDAEAPSAAVGDAGSPEEPGGPPDAPDAGSDDGPGREEPPAPDGADQETWVDLGERVRRRLEADRRGEPGGGPAPGDFDDMLAGFRAQAAETSGEADPAAHVELGVALRQMGLLDDAVREFQVAARAPEPPVRAFEALGECFLEKDLHRVAVRVLNRALRLPGRPDHELLGVLYQLGVAYQRVAEHREALDCFERVFSVDIDFRDVAERMETVRSEV